MRRAPLVAGIALTLAVLAAPAQARLPAQTFKVDITFKQARTWNYYHQQTSPECTRTSQGSGIDRANMHLSGLLTVRSGARAVAGLAVRGRHGRDGSRTHATAGAECAAPDVSEPNSGCGDKEVRPVFPTLTLTGRSLKLRWAGATVPEFNPCPWFGGASEGEGLPGAEYLDLTGSILAGELSKARKRRGVAGVSARTGGAETCATLQQPCPQGVTYNAGVTVESSMSVVFVPRKRR